MLIGIIEEENVYLINGRRRRRRKE